MNRLLITIFFVGSILNAQSLSSCIEKIDELQKLQEEKEWDKKQKYMLMLTGTFLTDYKKQTRLRDERIRVLKIEVRECK